jgi:hypothetical protein
VLFIAGDCLHSSLLRIKRGEEDGEPGGVLVSLFWYSVLFLWRLILIGNFIVNKLWAKGLVKFCFTGI